MARYLGASRPVAVTLVLSLLGAPALAQVPEQHVRITGSVTNVREGASPAARVLFQLKAGDVARLIATSGAWYRIESDGRQGYVLARLVGCVVAGEYPKLDACFVPADTLARAEVHFRAADADPWYAVPLSADGPCHSAFLPKPDRDTPEFPPPAASSTRTS